MRDLAWTISAAAAARPRRLMWMPAPCRPWVPPAPGLQGTQGQPGEARRAQCASAGPATVAGGWMAGGWPPMAGDAAGAGGCRGDAARAMRRGGAAPCTPLSSHALCEHNAALGRGRGRQGAGGRGQGGVWDTHPPPAGGTANRQPCSDCPALIPLPLLVQAAHHPSLQPRCCSHLPWRIRAACMPCISGWWDGTRADRAGAPTPAGAGRAAASLLIQSQDGGMGERSELAGQRRQQACGVPILCRPGARPMAPRRSPPAPPPPPRPCAPARPRPHPRRCRRR